MVLRLARQEAAVDRCSGTGGAGLEEGRRSSGAKQGVETEMVGGGTREGLGDYAKAGAEGIRYLWSMWNMERLTKSDFREPVNIIGSDEMVSMNEMAEMVLGFENKKLPALSSSMST